MRTPNLGSVSYVPGDPPADPKELQRYLRFEFIKIKVAVEALAAGHLDKETEAPAKPRDGDYRYADGTSWNPGAGKGIYFHNGLVWTLWQAIP